MINSRNYRLFFVGFLTSSIGSSLVDAVWPVVAYWLTASPLITSLTVIAQVIPQLFFGLIAGASVDRSPSKRNFLIYPNLISAIAFIIATVTGAGTIFALIVALICYSVSESAAIFYSSAVPAVFPQIVERENIVSARSYIEIAIQIVNFFSPAIAVYILGRFSERPLFLVNAITFLCAAGFLSLIRIPGSKEVIRQKENPSSQLEVARILWADICSGARYLWNHRLIRILTLVGVLNAFSGGVVYALYLNLADIRYSVSPGDNRAAYSVYAMMVGGIIGSLLLPRLRKKGISPLLVAGLSLFVTALSSLIIATGTNLIQLLAGLLLWQAGYGLVIINAAVLRMEIVDEEYLGRVSATARLVSWSASPVGALIGGLVVSKGVITSAALIGWLGALPLLGIGCLAYFHRAKTS